MSRAAAGRSGTASTARVSSSSARLAQPGVARRARSCVFEACIRTYCTDVIADRTSIVVSLTASASPATIGVEHEYGASAAGDGGGASVRGARNLVVD